MGTLHPLLVEAYLQRYGDDKGACENIFSYGFLEDNVTSAKVIFIDLEIPDDDPLRPAKIFVSTAAPGFRLFEVDNNINWESDFIWLVVINEEDGLDFKIRQTIDGKREIQAFWKEKELQDTSKLREYLQEDSMWELYQLRATVLLQQRVEMQIDTLQEMRGHRRESSIREMPWRLAEQLRSLELSMLESARSVFEEQVRFMLTFTLDVIVPLRISYKHIHSSQGRPMCTLHGRFRRATSRRSSEPRLRNTLDGLEER